MICLFVWLAKKVGTALMFPGESGYFRGQVEMAYSNEMGKNAQQALSIISKICDDFVRGVVP